MKQASGRSGLILTFLLTQLVIAVLACGSRETPVKVDLGKTEETSLPGTQPPAAPPLRVAAGGIITPREGIIYYRQMVDYLARRLGRSPQLMDRVTYQEINDMLREGQLDLAFVCTGPYVDGHREFGLQILAVPQVDGEVVYRSYIIVSADSPFQSMKDLRGRKFALTDPLSHSGCQYPGFLLARMGETPESFFSKVDYTYAHDKSILAVASGTVDGAAVDSLIWKYINASRPEVTKKTRIIEISPPFGSPPVVVNPAHTDTEMIERMRRILLSMEADSEGAEILRQMKIERFVAGQDSQYDSVRRFIEEKSTLSPREKL